MCLDVQYHKERPMLNLSHRKTCYTGQSFFLLNSLLNTPNVGDHVDVRMVTLLRKTDILKIIEMIEMMLAFKKLNKCWGKNTKHHISDILKALFYSLKQFLN